MQVGNVYGGPEEFMLLANLSHHQEYYEMLVFDRVGKVKELKRLWSKQLEKMSPIRDGIAVPKVHLTRFSRVISPMTFNDMDIFTYDYDSLGLVVGRGKDSLSFSCVLFDHSMTIKGMRVDTSRESHASHLMIGSGYVPRVVLT